MGFNIEKITQFFSSSIAIIISFLILQFSVKSLIYIFKTSSRELYSELENNLTYIYFNFEEYEKELKK